MSASSTSFPTISWVFPADGDPVPPTFSEVAGLGPVRKGDKITLLFDPPTYKGLITLYCCYNSFNDGQVWNITNTGSPFTYTFDKTTNNPSDPDDEHICHFFWTDQSLGTNGETFQYLNDPGSTPTTWNQALASSRATATAAPTTTPTTISTRTKSTTTTTSSSHTTKSTSTSSSTSNTSTPTPTSTIPPNSAPITASSQSSSSGLGTGALVGIIVGILLFIIIAGILGFFFGRRARRRNAENRAEPAPSGLGQPYNNPHGPVMLPPGGTNNEKSAAMGHYGAGVGSQPGQQGYGYGGNQMMDRGYAQGLAGFHDNKRYGEMGGGQGIPSEMDGRGVSTGPTGVHEMAGSNFRGELPG